MSFVPLYDLESLNEQQRQDYVRAVCNHMGVPPELNLVMLTYLDENEGPRRLVAYAKRGATEIIRNNRGISITDLTSKDHGGSVVYTATGKDNTGRQEMSTGSKFIAGLTGKELDDAIMTAQTRATRRMTLQFVGAGVLDESEVNPNRTIQSKETSLSGMAAQPQPIMQPSNAPGRDITAPQVGPEMTPEYVAAVLPTKTLEQFSKEQEQLRADAIAQLNRHSVAQNPPKEGVSSQEIADEPAKKRKYVRKSRVDMGPSEPPPTASIAQIVPMTSSTHTMNAPVPGTLSQMTTVIVSPPSITVPPLTPMVPITAVSGPSKPRLTPEQVKPFRQRQFKFVNELEMGGFSPKEGMGNQDKMRSFAGIMFPEVTNFNELTIDQWEKYLTTIENKLSTVGAKETIKYIEDAIGI